MAFLGAKSNKTALAEDPRFKLIYEEAIRGWTLQSSVLDELRNRTGILLSAASVASAFLGSADLTRHPSASWLSALAFVAFAVVVVLCVYVLWPTKGWCFAHESGAVTREYIKKGKSLDYMYENLARAADNHWTENDEKLKYMFSAFRWASAALGVSIGFWLADLQIR
jgi:uncharacterized membrane protein YfcA